MWLRRSPDATREGGAGTEVLASGNVSNGTRVTPTAGDGRSPKEGKIAAGPISRGVVVGDVAWTRM